MGTGRLWLMAMALIGMVRTIKTSLASALDNGVIGDPKVNCMEDRLKLTFSTEKPFRGRIFVKGMIDNDKCVSSYASNAKQTVDFQLTNGACNMRRSRKLGPEQRGVEQSITVIISFHDIFITKVDKAYRTTCFYMEADRVVTNRFDVSMLPTTELIDTARMPICTYGVRRGSVNGPIVNYATVGEPVFHVWQCDSDMFSMLVHNCFVDDGAGKDRKPLIDEHGCTMDPIIVPDLQYNNQANLAFAEVQVFKFADKITTYFQCAVSTCMVSEGMCKGKTPPRCGANNRKRRTTLGKGLGDETTDNSTNSFPYSDKNTMDLSAGKIVVLDLDDTASGWSHDGKAYEQPKSHDSTGRVTAAISQLPSAESRGRFIQDFNWSPTFYSPPERVCFSYRLITILASSIILILMVALTIALLYCLFSGRYLASRKF